MYLLHCKMAPHNKTGPPKMSLTNKDNMIRSLGLLNTSWKRDFQNG